MSMHLFIVDEKTFPIHLKYMFAGTGCSDGSILSDANNSLNYLQHWSKEKNICGMIADASRIRKGDKIVFYCTDINKFYGIFRAKDISFLEEKGNYLQKDLNKCLFLRVLIETYKVYSDGKLEWDVVDRFPDSGKSIDMLWTIIYRKLEGKRGNTVLNKHEEKLLTKILQKKNTCISCSSKDHFSFNGEKIEIDNNLEKYFSQKIKNIDILQRLIYKYNKNQSFETHLQAYLAKNIEINNDLKKIFNIQQLNWIGNEIYCSMGGRRIDLMLDVTNNKNQRLLYPIELKDEKIKSSIADQLQRYIDWLEVYYLPCKEHKTKKIIPVIIAKYQKEFGKEVKDKFKKFNKQNRKICAPIKCVGFYLNDTRTDIVFEEMFY